ncbi:MAG: VacB/RNase II family 3'-5' exoribonuclease [Lachnospiraceae bacterium]|nr:VacB/RNase II family 3'-5' exoribonuclease [Lachnospiraceae bacterium]
MNIFKRKKIILKLMREDLYLPMKEKELAALLQVKSENRPILKQVLNELLADGKIEVSKRGKYSLKKKVGQEREEKAPKQKKFFKLRAESEIQGFKEKKQKIKIIRDAGEPGMDVLAIIKAAGLPYTFNEKTLLEAEKAAGEAIPQEEILRRTDLRSLVTVTIDGADAKDLDDAISIGKEGSNFRLGVHIADVAHYVKEGSALDLEAKLRGTSTYLVDRVIPMLPTKLSNGICSLNAGEDRLALSCIMLVSPQGEVLEHEIKETVIKISRRLTYDLVMEIIEGKKPDDFKPLISLMEDLAIILKKKRKKRGSLDFEFPESKILIDDSGVPYDILPYFGNKATRIIEEFMLLANETVAEHFFRLKSPFIYRSHENPDPEKIEELKIALGNFGYKMGGSRAKHKPAKRKSKNWNNERRKSVEQLEKFHSRDVQLLLKQAAGTPYEKLVNRLTLRSMKRASYSIEETSHFGLASPYYCHFSSPIRRYPDLQIHRIIKEHLNGQFTKARSKHYLSILPKVAKKSSELERRAEETEREVIKLKKAEYMEDHLGEIYDGVISGVTLWGIYVELPNTVDGLVLIKTIPGDYYQFDELTMRLVGRNTGVSYRLGQPVKIWVKAADKWSRLVDFELVIEE